MRGVIFRGDRILEVLDFANSDRMDAAVPRWCNQPRR
jgi:hypothetical protein